jgi:dienelactone hydrolase
VSPTEQINPDWLTPFEYDSQAPLVLQQEVLRTEKGVAISDLSYASPAQGRVEAYLIEPAAERLFAGVIFFHWYEPKAASNNRSEFLEEAVELAKAGAVSLLIQGFLPWTRLPDAADPQEDRQMVANQVLELRRGVDILTSRPGVDPNRLAFVGHDFGAMYGAVMGAVDDRLSAYVLMASTGSFSNWFFKYWQSEGSRDEEAYRAGMAPVDPISYLAHISPAALLFQFADQDIYVSKADAQEQYAAARQPKQIQWYQASHELNAAAQMERMAWLKEQLDLGQ